MYIENKNLFALKKYNLLPSNLLVYTYTSIIIYIINREI